MGEIFDIVDKPIFLHFLNREIRETEQARFEDFEVFQFIMIAALIMQQYIYVGDAIVWECCSVFPRSIKLLRELEKQGLACFIGTNDDIHSFLEKRRRLYQFDRNRYPVYFSDDVSSMPWATNHRLIQTDTTAVLATDFFKIANDFMPESRDFSEADKERINLSLEYRRRNNSAVTYSLFKKQKFSQSSKLRLKRQIIASYDQHYLNVMSGKIMTGIPGLDYYDTLQKSGLYFNFPFHDAIYGKLGMLCKPSTPVEQTAYALLDVRMQKNFKLLIQEIKKICCGITRSSISPALFLARLHVHPSESFDTKVIQLWEVSQLLCKENPKFREGYYQMSEDKRKVLVLAASPLEYRILRQTAYERGYRFVDKQDPGNEEFSYAECNESLDKKLFLAWTDMNSLHSSLAIQQLSNLLHPDYVIMGGICAGLHRDSQSIGEIIIADNIHDYNAAKEADTRRIMRGLTIESSRFLKEKFLIESYSSSLTASTGQLVSSNTLANSKAYLQKVLEDCPDAKGYEMEGSGLIHVCQSFQEKWILVKAICDWGYDKTDSDQELAARNSYSFIFDVVGKEW